MPADDDKFSAAVLACVHDINVLLPDLARQYSDLAMVTALGQHVGGALRLFIRNGVCTPEQARRILAHMEESAFPGTPR